MVWRWPKNNFTILETGVLPNTSNIRLLRVKSALLKSPDLMYWKELAETSRFHHAFWAENNRLYQEGIESFDSESQLEEFYQKFAKERAEAFSSYHRETWRRNLGLVVVGYVCIYEKVMKKIKSFKFIESNT